MLPALHAPSLRAALDIASMANGVRSTDLALSRHLSLASAAAKLAIYAESGYLAIEGGSGKAGHPYVYRLTDAGKRRIKGIPPANSAHHDGLDFGPLLEAWGT